MRIKRMLSCLALLSGCLPAWGFADQEQKLPPSPYFSLVELASGVYAAMSAEGSEAVINAGLIDLGDATLVFDAFYSPRAAADLAKAARVLFSRPVTYLAFSHYHNDHVRGCPGLGDPAICISSKWTAEILRVKKEDVLDDSRRRQIEQEIVEIESRLETEKDPVVRHELRLGEGFDRGILQAAGARTVDPRFRFTGDLQIRGSKRSVRLCSGKGASTPGDVVLYLPEERIVFSGDAVMIGMNPYLSESSPHDWRKTLMEMKEMSVRTIVPGHGPIGGVSHIDTMILYLDSVEKAAKEMMKAKTSGKPPAADIPRAFSMWAYKKIFQANVEFMKDDLIRSSSLNEKK